MVNWPSQAQLLEFGDFCHKHEPAIVFIKADARGLFSSIFSDFGPTHVVLDKNGEEPKQAIVVSISNVTTSLLNDKAFIVILTEQSRYCNNAR